MGHKEKHHKDGKHHKEEDRKHHKEKHHKKEKKKHHKDDAKAHHAKDQQKREKMKPAPAEPGTEECQAPDYHKMHMCVLKHMGQMQLFDELSSNPTHRCSRCGCSSNQRQNLCQPYEL